MRRDKTNYWEKRDELSKKAIDHITLMNSKYESDIKSAIKNTEIYMNSNIEQRYNPNYHTNIKVIDSNSVSAVFQYANDYCEDKYSAVLNFASFKNPGGCFLGGSMAQEESLCHSSILYNVLSDSKFSDFYGYNRISQNKSLYSNRALYSKDILFVTEEGTEAYCDVITCAAPNKESACKYGNVSEKENYEALRDRIAFVLKIAIHMEVTNLILGAYGCGVFGQNPLEVSQIFKEYLDTWAFGYFENVIFAIPDSSKNDNYAVFKSIFEKEKVFDGYIN